MKRFLKIGIPVVVVVIIGFRMFVGEVCNVPTGSMYPTIIIGDWLWIEKTTYGARIPRRFADIPLLNVFTWIKSLREADEENDWGYRRLGGKRAPRIGDIAVFESPESPHPLLVKRIAGKYWTGDTVVINARNFYNLYHIVYNEGHKMFMRNDSVFIDRQPDSICVVSQPYYYMLGDNRENSADSRVFGYVPESAIVGRMSRVLISVNTKRSFISMVRWDRFLKRIQ